MNANTILLVILATSVQPDIMDLPKLALLTIAKLVHVQMVAPALWMKMVPSVPFA